MRTPMKVVAAGLAGALMTAGFSLPAFADDGNGTNGEVELRELYPEV